MKVNMKKTELVVFNFNKNDVRDVTLFSRWRVEKMKG